jgi:dUTP pyrophosphatase
MEIKVKKLHEDAILPVFAKEGDAGADLTATSIEFKNHKVIYGTGISVEIPDGYCMKIYPRSSIYKTSLRLCNNVGIIDSGYRNEIKLIFDFIGYGFRELYHEFKDLKLKLYNKFNDKYKFKIFKKQIEIDAIEKLYKEYVDYSYDVFLREVYEHPMHNIFYKTGDRIGQAIIEKLVPTKYIEVKELDMSNDRGGGLGSTGRR